MTGTSTALLTDHYELTMVAAALADGHRATAQCVFETFARRLPDGRRYGVVGGTGAAARGDQPVPVRRRGARRAGGARGGRPAHARLARGLPLRRRRRRLPRGRAVLPRLAAVHGARHVRRGRAAGDAGAVDPQPRQRDRVRGRADGERRERAADHRDGRAAHARGGRGGRRAGGLPGRLRDDVEPGGRPPLRHSRPRAPARTRSRCCTTASTPRSPRRSPRWAPDTTLLVDTYDITAGIETAIEVAGTVARRDPHRLR